MMYNNKLAAAIKVNGKVLREFKDTAYIPFGSEYTILIKNLNTVRVMVRVDIDGTDATGGSSLVIGPNQETELKRFVKDGNLSCGNSFKFIERSAHVENTRGVGIQDGLIRIEYQFELPVIETWYKPVNWSTPRDRYGMDPYPMINSPLRGVTTDVYGARSIGTLQSQLLNVSGSTVASNSFNASEAAYACSASAPVKSAVGITVPGSVSDQQFQRASSFAVETTKHVMVINLLGETESGAQVTQPVTVRSKPKCVTCGVQNKAKAKFCSACGTALTIV